MNDPIFVPSRIEHGFHPITAITRASSRVSHDPRDVTNSRYDDGPAYYHDNPKEFINSRYSIPKVPIPLEKPRYFSRPITGISNIGQRGEKREQYR